MPRPKVSKRSPRGGSSSVELMPDGVLHVYVKGRVTAGVVDHILEQTRPNLLRAHASGKKALVLVDLSQVTGQTKAARLNVGRSIIGTNYDRVAIFGGGKEISRVMAYIIKSTRLINRRVRYFKHERDALAWLKGNKAADISIGLARVTSALAVGLSLAVLYGWLAHVQLLTTTYRNLSPLNPLAAICFGLIGVVVFVQTLRLSDRYKKWTMYGLLGVVIAVSVWILFIYAAHVHLRIDRLLFGGQVRAKGVLAEMAVRTALGLILLSSALLLARRRTRVTQEISQVILLALLFVLCVALAGMAFGAENLYTFGNIAKPPALSGLIMGLLLAIGIFALHDEWALSKRFSELNRAFVLGVVVLCLAELLTGIAWRQANTKVRQDAAFNYTQEINRIHGTITDRVDNYVRVLHGMQAFFQSSDFVSRKDFHDYFASIDAPTAYPGFSAISFIAYVNDANRQAFLDMARSDASMPDFTYPNFTINSTAQSGEQYIATYTEPLSQASAGNIGLDSGQDPERRRAFELARDTGQPVSTGPISILNPSVTDPNQRRFVMTVPVYNGLTPGTVSQRREAIKGFVNAGFMYDNLFGELLKDEAGKGVTVKVVDKDTNTTVYAAAPKDSGQNYHRSSSIIFAAGRPWVLELGIPVNFGVSNAETSLPLLLITGGTFISFVVALLVGVLAFGRDRAAALAERITEDLRAERNAAVANQRKDEAILSSIGDAVFAIDMRGRITVFNPAAEAITGYTRREALRKPYGDILKFRQEESGNEASEFIAKALGGKATAMQQHTELVRKDGSRVAVADSAAPIRDPRGSMLGVIVVFRDITSERELERAKDEFVSLTSHQLRTPLTAIRLFSEMLSDDHVGALSDQQASYAGKIQVSTDRMIRLVGEILNVSRIELGELAIRPSENDLGRLIQTHIDEVMPLAQERGATISFKAPRKRIVANVDANLLGQVIHNLLSNALRYSKRGKGNIKVRVEQKPRSYVISVADNGIGIPKAAQKDVFNRFFRADNAVETEADGTGLGLYLVRMIMKTAGGTVHFESEEGVGTTFYVTIPLKGMKPKAGNKELSKVA